MKRLAILGANGQVGTEVSLRLRDVEGIEVVPIARNVSGSAFLRSNGVECRHGRISDPAEASSLMGDCDVVVNFALSNTAIPRADREMNRQIIRSTVAAAKPGAPIVFASTIMVYAPGMNVWLPDSYGLEKLVAEYMFRMPAAHLIIPRLCFAWDTCWARCKTLLLKSAARSATEKSHCRVKDSVLPTRCLRRPLSKPSFR